MMKAGFFDIDGTLLNIMKQQTHITERSRRALHALRAAGCKTFIASGAITELCEARGVEYILEGAEHTYLKRDFLGFEAFYQSIGVDTDFFVRDYDLDTLEIGKMEFYSTEPLGGGLFEELLQWPGMTGVMDPYHKKNLELYAKDITKGSGILHALQALDIPVAESFAFGDGVNDIEMMQTVGLGIAMGNARPQVQDVAKEIVPSVDDDGVAWGIEHLILKGDR